MQKRLVLICEDSLNPIKLPDVSGAGLGEAGRYNSPAAPLFCSVCWLPPSPSATAPPSLPPPSIFSHLYPFPAQTQAHSAPSPVSLFPPPPGSTPAAGGQFRAVRGRIRPFPHRICAPQVGMRPLLATPSPLFMPRRRLGRHGSRPLVCWVRPHSARCGCGRPRHLLRHPARAVCNSAPSWSSTR